jgi:hypothetical protein
VIAVNDPSYRKPMHIDGLQGVEVDVRSGVKNGLPGNDRYWRWAQLVSATH